MQLDAQVCQVDGTDQTMCGYKIVCCHDSYPVVKWHLSHHCFSCDMHVEVITRTANGKLLPEIVKAEGVAAVGAAHCWCSTLFFFIKQLTIVKVHGTVPKR